MSMHSNLHIGLQQSDGPVKEGFRHASALLYDRKLGSKISPKLLGGHVDRILLGRALKEIADSQWEKSKQPVLLSALPDLLRDKLPGQTSSKPLGGSLKSFIKATGDAFGYKLLEHPTQKAKLGLLPKEAEYDFETAQSLVSSAAAIAPGDGNAFVAILAKLSEQELQSITIPASVLVKLFGKK